MAILPGGCTLAGTRMSPSWILLELRMTEVIVAAEARHAQLQSNHQHQQTNIQLFTGRMSFLLSTNSDKALKGTWEGFNNSNKRVHHAALLSENWIFSRFTTGWALWTSPFVAIQPVIFHEIHHFFIYIHFSHISSNGQQCTIILKYLEQTAGKVNANQTSQLGNISVFQTRSAWHSCSSCLRSCSWCCLRTFASFRSTNHHQQLNNNLSLVLTAIFQVDLG